MITLSGICTEQRQQTVAIEDVAQDVFETNLPNPFPGPHTVMARKEIAAAVQQAIAELPEHYRQVVVLRDLDGLRYAEIAEILGIEPGTVQSRISRGRGLLRDKLRDVVL